MYYIGIDVGGTNLVAGLVDADGHIQDKASRPVPRDMTAQQFGGYLVELAGCFHRFYTVCRIKGEEDAVLKARLKLADAARSVLANGLTLIGVTAPEKM